MKLTLEVNSKFINAVKLAAELINSESGSSNEELATAGKIMSKFHEDLALTALGNSAVVGKLKEFENFLRNKGYEVGAGEVENFINKKNN